MEQAVVDVLNRIEDKLDITNQLILFLCGVVLGISVVAFLLKRWY